MDIIGYKIGKYVLPLPKGSIYNTNIGTIMDNLTKDLGVTITNNMGNIDIANALDTDPTKVVDISSQLLLEIYALIVDVPCNTAFVSLYSYSRKDDILAYLGDQFEEHIAKIDPIIQSVISDYLDFEWIGFSRPWPYNEGPDIWEFHKEQQRYKVIAAKLDNYPHSIIRYVIESVNIKTDNQTNFISILLMARFGFFDMLKDAYENGIIFPATLVEWPYSNLDRNTSDILYEAVKSNCIECSKYIVENVHYPLRPDNDWNVQNIIEIGTVAQALYFIERYNIGDYPKVCGALKNKRYGIELLKEIFKETNYRFPFHAIRHNGDFNIDNIVSIYNHLTYPVVGHVELVYKKSPKTIRALANIDLHIPNEVKLLAIKTNHHDFIKEIIERDPILPSDALKVAIDTDNYETVELVTETIDPKIITPEIVGNVKSIRIYEYLKNIANFKSSSTIITVISKHSPKAAVDIMKLEKLPGNIFLAIAAVKINDLDTVISIMTRPKSPKPTEALTSTAFNKPELLQWFIDQGYSISPNIFLRIDTDAMYGDLKAAVEILLKAGIVPPPRVMKRSRFKYNFRELLRKYEIL